MGNAVREKKGVRRGWLDGLVLNLALTLVATLFGVLALLVSQYVIAVMLLATAATLTSLRVLARTIRELVEHQNVMRSELVALRNMVVLRQAALGGVEPERAPDARQPDEVVG